MQEMKEGSQLSSFLVN